MSRKRRMQSLQESKDRRMKKIAIGGAVMLAVVLAFEMPKVLGGGSKSSSPPAVTTTGASTTPSATPTPTVTPPGTAAAAVSQTSTKLPNSDLQPRRSKSQLYAFNHFAGKDPFVQQVTDVSQGQQIGRAHV